MAIGFGRSVLGGFGASSAVTSRGFFRTDGAGTQSDGTTKNSGSTSAYLQYEPAGTARVNAMSMVMWFRAKNSDYALPSSVGTTGGEHMTFHQVMGATGAGATRLQEFIFMAHLDGANDNANAAFRYQINDSSGSVLFTTQKTSTSAFDENNFDDSEDSAGGGGPLNGTWNCIMTVNSKTASERQIVFNGQNIIRDLEPDLTGDGIEFGAGVYTFGHFVNAFGQSGADIDIGPIWIYDQAIDFTNATTKAYYFNNANTDGFVDGGDDGTAGGAAAPEVYLYHNGTTIVNGGSDSGTLRLSGTAATNDVALSSADTGPGSGDTR